MWEQWGTSQSTIEEDIKQHLLRINIFTWVGLNNLHSTNLQELVVEDFFPVLLILGYQAYAIVLEQC